MKPQDLDAATLDAKVAHLLGDYGRGAPNEYSRALLASELRQEALLERVIALLEAQAEPAPSRRSRKG